MKYRILLLGSGGRESALAWKLIQSPLCGRLYALPGNPGIAEKAELVQGLGMDDYEALAQWCLRREIDLTVVGPEAPLVGGLVDVFQAHGLRVFGPDRAAAILEGSKVWTKSFLHRHEIPTARFIAFENVEQARAWLPQAPWRMVLKADGLAAGKGVILPSTQEEAEAALTELMEGAAFGQAGQRIVIEERLEGPEISVFALCDGRQGWILGSAQDYKRALDGDRGPNTGGMGSLAPSPLATSSLLQKVRTRILEPTLAGMAAEGRPYRGLLYLGLMITSEGPKVIEFNCRFGDPETQALLPLLEDDLLALLWRIADGQSLDAKALTTAASKRRSVCLVLADEEYPGKVRGGRVLHGLRELGGVQVFHAGTRLDGERLLSTGGRVLNLVAVADSFELARDHVYAAARSLTLEGLRWRQDIGAGLDQ